MVCSAKCFLLNFCQVLRLQYSILFTCCILQMAKEQLVLAFHKAELGTWLKKPIEQDQFELDDSVLNNRQ